MKIDQAEMAVAILNHVARGEAFVVSPHGYYQNEWGAWDEDDSPVLTTAHDVAMAIDNFYAEEA